MEEVKDILDEIFLNKEDILLYISKISNDIIHKYQDDKEVIILVLMDGALNFSNDLKKYLPSEKFKFEYFKISSYKNCEFSGNFDVDKREINLYNKEVLILDDIYDTGNTLSFMVNKLKNDNFPPKNIKTCVLIERENNHQKLIDIDFFGKKINDDRFLIGYGLDFNDKYRDLDFIFFKKNN